MDTNVKPCYKKNFVFGKKIMVVVAVVQLLHLLQEFRFIFFKFFNEKRKNGTQHEFGSRKKMFSIFQSEFFLDSFFIHHLLILLCMCVCVWFSSTLKNSSIVDSCYISGFYSCTNKQTRQSNENLFFWIRILFFLFKNFRKK